MRKALLVGINCYDHFPQLFGCNNDASSVESVLSRNQDGSKNFECKLLLGSQPEQKICRSKLKDQIEELFKADGEIALFYFAGHGHIEVTGGYLLTSDAKRGDEGIPLSEILKFANESKSNNKIIILDSCHSGIAGNSIENQHLASLSEGVTFLTASTENQYAAEENGQGVFTSLLVDALNGSAANLTGDISIGSIYAHIDQSLGAWEQRPVFKTNVKQFVSLRKTKPAIDIEDLKKISSFFPTPDFSFKLDPTFEPEMKGRDEGMPKPIEKNTRIFSILQKYNRLNLLIPVEAPHMWHAAMKSKSCKLTALGEHYRMLCHKDRI